LSTALMRIGKRSRVARLAKVESIVIAFCGKHKFAKKNHADLGIGNGRSLGWHDNVGT
jgi:hypothetical protein